MPTDEETGFVQRPGSLRHRAIVGAAALSGRFRLTVARYRIPLAGWPVAARPLRVLVIADVHACEPWMTRERILSIVADANRLEPDLVLLAGDFHAGMRRFKTADVAPKVWAEALGAARAPLGLHAVLGNHDWEIGGDVCTEALERHGVRVLENDALRLIAPDGTPFWLAGLGCQYAYKAGRRFLDWTGRHDLPLTLSRIAGDEPAILLAHEPDIFPEVPDRIGLTVCGHTHGGQVCLPFYGALTVPSRYGRRYAYGHIREGNRHLVVSGGLGCSLAPIRLFRPPELVMIEVVAPESRAD